MTAPERSPAVGSAEEMRRRFDAVFAAPPVGRGADVASFLALRIGGDGFAFRIQHMSGLVAARRIVPLPGSASAMLGLAGIRGLVVPVFSLSVLMGYGSERPRWLALCAGEAGDTIALGFSDFDGYVEALASDVRAVDAVDAGEARPARRASFVRELVRGRGELRGVVDLSSVAKAAYATVSRQDR
jgi:purine-binding chemotaxis protein CheW